MSPSSAPAGYLAHYVSLTSQDTSTDYVGIVFNKAEVDHALAIGLSFAQFLQAKLGN
jgi:hypothetical protein